MKKRTILILLIPLIITLLVTYSPSFIYQLLILRPYSIRIIDEIKQKIEFKINYNKLYTQEEYIISQCKWLFTNDKQQYRLTVPQSINQDRQYKKQLCSLDNIGQMKIITIITNNLQKINNTIQQYIKIIQQQAPFQVYFQILPIKQSQYPQQIKNKLYLTQYSQSIAQYFTNTRYMQNCRYTNKQCTNHLLYLTSQLTFQYYQYRNVYITNINNVIQTINIILRLQPFTHFQKTQIFMSWRKYTYIIKLKQLLKKIKYIQYTLTQNKYTLPNIQILQTLNSVMIKMNSRTSITQWTNLISSLTSINIFPTQYKLGVYLPILFVFFLLTFSNYLKL